MQGYYWTPELRRFVEGLAKSAPSLVFLTGLQGSGKTNALMAIEDYVIRCGGGYYWRWDGGTPPYWREESRNRFLLIDLPDYLAGGGRRMMRDLDGVGRLWYDLRYDMKYGRHTIVVAVQRELFRGHYLIGKGEVFELRPLTVEELTGIYTRRFDRSTWPFDGASLCLVSALSRGVFRRFMRYVRLCVQDMQARGGDSISVGDVGRVIDIEVIGRDMDLELSGFLRGGERDLAVATMVALMSGEPMSQKELASRLGSTESTTSRLMGKLDVLGYISRTHGDRKELKVSLRHP
jgi:hypothetical protein